MHVTAARQSLITDRLNWRCAPLDAEVVCTKAVLETVRQHAAEGRTRLSHGGLEIGGILLGRRTDRSMEILGALPIECEHKLGPLFILSAADEKTLDAVLTGNKLGTLQPVGLYVSHSRRGFAVAETEAMILDRLPAGPWQLVLVVMPAKFGPARAGFFIREAVDRSFVCAHELMLTPMEHLLEPPPPPAPPAAPVPVSTPPAADKPISETGQTPVLRPIDSFIAQVKTHWRLSQWNMAVSLILLLLFVCAGGLFVRARSVSSTSIPMHVSDLGSNVRIEWDPIQKAVRSASRATLEIRDGERPPVAIPVTKTELDHGSVLYAPHSDNIEVRLKLMRGSAIASESVLYFINPQRRANAQPMSAPPVIPPPVIAPPVVPQPVSTPPVVARTVATPPVIAPPVALQPVSTPPVATKVSPVVPPPATMSPAAASPQPVKPPPPVQATQPVPTLRPEQPVQQVVEKGPKRDTEKPAKAFQLPVVQARTVTAQATPMNLPDLPEIRTSATPTPVISSSPLAAILQAPARLADPPQLRAGRLIWTGSLHKNAELSITPAGPSMGVLSGALPGVPVKVSLQPAELLDRGIAVYSKDPDRPGASQPPSAWNGWHVVVQDWDPKRIAEVSVVEAPGPGNNWKRLVLRSGNRNVSVFVVNWQGVAGQ
jgi:hypothetical protein